MTARIALGSTALLVSVALAVTACAPAAEVLPDQTVTASPVPSRGPAPSPPADPRPEVVWPLTGVDAAGKPAADLARPALSIKIENSAAAKPQENLQYADIVFEEYVEAGISRLIAVYQSAWPKSVGPIRSMRPMDPNIMSQLGGPLVFSGAQKRFVNAAAATGLKLITQDLGSPGFYRTSDKAAPHNLHGYLATFGQQVPKAKAPPEQWAFAYPARSATAQRDGTVASYIDIYMSPYAQPEWRFSDSKQMWMRYEGKAKHVTTDGTQLAAKNVLMMWVTVRYTGGGGHSSVPETLIAGKSGWGYLASGNKFVTIRWSKKGQWDPFVITTSEGAPVTLIPGKTWVELVPNKGVAPGKIDIS